jgi:hypothetical protein
MRLDLSCKIISLTLNDRFAVTDVSSCFFASTPNFSNAAT